MATSFSKKKYAQSSLSLSLSSLSKLQNEIHFVFMTNNTKEWEFQKPQEQNTSLFSDYEVLSPSLLLSFLLSFSLSFSLPLSLSGRSLSSFSLLFLFSFNFSSPAVCTCHQPAATRRAMAAPDYALPQRQNARRRRPRGKKSEEVLTASTSSRKRPLSPQEETAEIGESRERASAQRITQQRVGDKAEDYNVALGGGGDPASSELGEDLQVHRSLAIKGQKFECKEGDCLNHP